MSTPSSRVEAPNFGQLLAPFIVEVPEPARPGFLARLERGAAERYRSWAEAAPADERPGLLACAGREDEIADRVSRLFPVAPEDAAKLEGQIGAALETYLSVFADLSLVDQLRIQANAERQGAAAWRGMASALDDRGLEGELEACARLEESSADHLDGLVRRLDEP